MGVGEQLKGALGAIVPESPAPDVTLVVPGLNEAESLPLLAAQVKEALGPETSYELIFIDDGSTDDTWNVIEELNAADSAVRGVRLRKNFGKAMALAAGFERARDGTVDRQRHVDQPLHQLDHPAHQRRLGLVGIGVGVEHNAGVDVEHRGAGGDLGECIAFNCCEVTFVHFSSKFFAAGRIDAFTNYTEWLVETNDNFL